MGTGLQGSAQESGQDCGAGLASEQLPLLHGEAVARQRLSVEALPQPAFCLRRSLCQFETKQNKTHSQLRLVQAQIWRRQPPETLGVLPPLHTRAPCWKEKGRQAQVGCLPQRAVSVVPKTAPAHIWLQTQCRAQELCGRNEARPCPRGAPGLAMNAGLRAEGSRRLCSKMTFCVPGSTGRSWGSPKNKP